jgi:subtilase family serine protease
VTSLGGTQLHLDANGNRLQPDVVWNDGFGAGGGGVSAVFRRPFFQDALQRTVGSQRGTPDVSMSAAVDGGVVVYFTFINPTSPWHIFGGTSEASPLFAGVVSIADQAAHHRLGWLNPRLYRLSEANAGIVDVTSGNNSFAGVTGFTAGPGYDLASGLGTIDAAKLVASLAHDRDDNSGDDGAGDFIPHLNTGS